MKIEYLTRRQWGAAPAIDDYLTNRRYKRLPDIVECVQVHHTASIDNDDSTPNRWDYDEALRYTRALQWARPDLIPMPYNETVAVSEDLQTAWIFEGCGLDTVGAHTRGHNRHGYGISVYGNFDRADDPARDALLSVIEQRIRSLRRSTFPNLGLEPNPQGWDVWGHRDSAAKSCPGNTLYMSLERVTFKEEDDDMATIPQPSWCSDADIQRCVDARILTSWPREEERSTWQTIVYFSRHLQHQQHGGGSGINPDDFAKKRHNHTIEGRTVSE